MFTKRICRLDAPRESIARNLRCLRVTYSIGRDYDHEIRSRVFFVREALIDVRKHNAQCSRNTTIANRHSGYLLRVLSLYFTHFYKLLSMHHVRTVENACGVALDVDKRTLYMYCNESILETSISCAETLRCERIMVNDYRIDEYDSAVDKRVHSILAFAMNIESALCEEFRGISTEKTLVEMVLSDDSATKNRCSNFTVESTKSSFAMSRVTTKRRWNEADDTKC